MTLRDTRRSIHLLSSELPQTVQEPLSWSVELVDGTYVDLLSKLHVNDGLVNKFVVDADGLNGDTVQICRDCSDGPVVGDKIGVPGEDRCDKEEASNALSTAVNTYEGVEAPLPTGEFKFVNG
ncbi:hypothetical protein PI124_g15877 [Phytophthora idaei]|nr:hypothetical protein PI125_g8564 [Phytophthora idaei]KAG3239184.1 hypothetical protein PI124_g15877 [Phytophthora idaei]